MDYQIPFPGAAAPFAEEEDDDESSDEEEEEIEPAPFELGLAPATLTALRRSGHNDQDPSRPSQRRRIG